MYKIGYFMICLAFTLISCGKESDDAISKDDFVSRTSKEAYTGTAKSVMHLHGYETFPSVAGTGTFNVIQTKGDSVTLALTCNLSSGDGFSFGMPGIQLGNSWSATFQNGGFAIDNQGDVSGAMQTTQQEISWDGRLFDDKILLDVKIKYLQQDRNITAGTIINTHLDLIRADAPASENINGCKVIVWETRAVLNLYSYGSDLLRVPVCHD
ncbi:hypothetical protein [Sphingobacterium corticibacter]|uniref:Uncharacterized protein n=1 Tax=Sphingobacterium corticibacter TaxID=2171749 RepID=A0A2T8HIH5_9SPHI|nr:hypothetical protein [Sphingobacterium corticibacter]PVH25231.1 hypothetical protein DC487_09920 [Sphingobacterium corticibacter]